jgi:FG-GAP repeat protein
MFRLITAFLICGLHLFGNTVFAAPLLITETQLTASDAAARDLFGSTVAASGDTIVVGTFNDPNTVDHTIEHAEAAYVFVRSGETWIEQAIFTAFDADKNDVFGGSVAISGDTVVVGAPGKNSRRGAAYVFVRSGTSWSLQQKLTVGGIGQFGNSVAIEGDTLVVGAWRDFVNNAGSAYVFVRSGATWTQQAKLTASDPAGFDIFGFAVALSGDTVVVGKPQAEFNSGNQKKGAAYVFVRSGTSWSLQTKLTASDPSKNAFFGGSVTLLGDTAVIGAPGANTAKGAAYVFARTGTTWTEQIKLRASDVDSLDFFGTAVDLFGDTLVVGAAGDRGFRGSAYVFAGSGATWFEKGKLTASDGAKKDFFGDTLALASEDTVVVGAFKNDSAGKNSGSAYVFDLVFDFFQATLTGTKFCDDGSGTGQKQKFKDKATFTLGLSTLPLITTEIELENSGQSFAMSGMALFKDKKSGVLQLFGDDNGPAELAVSANIKTDKKTGAWQSLKGKFQLQDNDDPACTLAGKFKAK